MKVIKLAEVKQRLAEQAELKTVRANAFNRLKEANQSDSAKFNHEFYRLVDLFMQEHYPDYVLRWNVWLDKIEKSKS